MRWFRVYAELIDDPKFIKLGPDLRCGLLMTWCVAAANDGRLPPIEDIAIKLRMPEARAARLIDELRRHGFIDEDERGLAPHNWASRQYKSDVSAERTKRYRQRQRDVTVTAPDSEQNRTDSEAVTALIEVRDEAALAAWDAYGRQTRGKAYPRNRRGGWRFPTKWPPGHQAEVRPIGRTA
jgi:hypothetical protein